MSFINHFFAAYVSPASACKHWSGFCREIGSKSEHDPKFPDLGQKAIGEALDLTSGENEQLLKLNKLECKYVAHKLSETREVLQSAESTTGSSDAFELCIVALKKIYRVVTKSFSLIQDCYGEQWLRAAIRKRSDMRSKDFAEVCYACNGALPYFYGMLYVGRLPLWNQKGVVVGWAILIASNWRWPQIKIDRI
jgi:hypothetical protein